MYLPTFEQQFAWLHAADAIYSETDDLRRYLRGGRIKAEAEFMNVQFRWGFWA